MANHTFARLCVSNATVQRHWLTGACWQTTQRNRKAMSPIPSEQTPSNCDGLTMLHGRPTRDWSRPGVRSAQVQCRPKVAATTARLATSRQPAAHTNSKAGGQLPTMQRSDSPVMDGTFVFSQGKVNPSRPASQPVTKSVHPSVRACVRACVRASVRP